MCMYVVALGCLGESNDTSKCMHSSLSYIYIYIHIYIFLRLALVVIGAEGILGAMR